LLLNIRTKGKGSISVQCRAGDLEPGTINIQYKKPLAMFTKYLSALSLTGQLLFGLTTLGNASVVTKPTDQQVIYPPSTVPIVDMHTHMDAKTQYAKAVETMDQWGGTISISLAGIFWVKDNNGNDASPVSVKQIPYNEAPGLTLPPGPPIPDQLF
jgi:hypothetical protein